MKDIKTRTDIENLVNSFYKKVLKSEIAYIFTDVVVLDLKSHLPIMYNFWASVLLNENKYRGNPIKKHLELNSKSSLTDKEFKVWLNLFNETVDDMFVGQVASEAKSKANSIAQMMKIKIAQSN